MEADPPNALGQTTENGTSTDIINAPEVETAVEYSSKLCYDDALMVQVSHILTSYIDMFGFLYSCTYSFCFSVIFSPSVIHVIIPSPL